ncbi:hypothetical protein BO79DRAFT_217788 [Aspergillus costaricaensis CBS 115574]|uniref:uncharacterized protein n=1 Tax=Aspergillus costaricaensis CBS 115574 TaxID=1448317 RepID=UPI000DBD5B49|nr:hypothetical protein BO79DRAFT_217788 [Aspergillus costaricaensis CBS 115574]RAK88468.1 hypothetical protein BO79DRAFT_217788 [Aspergillus costaricaensis CBS 115574]
MSQLARWVRAHPANVVVVPMNAVRVVSLHEMFAIGTEGLGACSAIVIASSRGAILAHIPPRPTASASDPYAGDNNVRRLMTEVTALYMRYRDEYFSSHTDTLIVCALYQGAIALPDQVQIMHSALSRLGPSVCTYDVPGNYTNPGQGTVLAIGNRGLTSLGHPNEGRARIYVEDQQYVPRPPS